MVLQRDHVIAKHGFYFKNHVYGYPSNSIVEARFIYNNRLLCHKICKVLL